MSKGAIVKPELIKTLEDWVARYPKASNIDFDPETREPTIYSDAARTSRVRSIPWKREADALTILTSPSQFSTQAVAAATSRVGKIREQRSQMNSAAEEELRVAEANVLNAWRAYNAGSNETRGTLRRDILTAEATLTSLQKKFAPVGRRVVEEDGYSTIYVPPMPVARRGISVTGAASEV